jgi:UDP-N-acetylmuramoyl-tripeptide--D-alanyl-D-alanine ligase
MGIRHPGDIAELCAIARPRIALVTSVGIAHLESMGSIDSIAKEKGSLLSFVEKGGHAVLNADDDRVRRMGWDFEGTVWPVTCEDREESVIRATDIRYGPEGAVFTVVDERGDSVEMSTRLIGRHNVTNLLMAVAVGRIYGLRLRQIRRAVGAMAPVPHRLEVRREGAVTIIDDAFNSNPVGAKNAVEILGQMGSGRRYVVTPGMIELGPEEDRENAALGSAIARHADEAILVGPDRTLAIARGLREAGFPDESIRVVGSLFEARDYLKSRLRDGDVVLFENDLPDQFNEG